MSHFVVQRGLKLLASSNLPALAFQSVEITIISHHSWPLYYLLMLLHRVLLCCPGWSAVVQCNLHLLGSSNSPASASRIAGITGMLRRTERDGA
ncbi:hypothetical protein AAY473_004993 [Plecturocebus cupreus]